MMGFVEQWKVRAGTMKQDIFVLSLAYRDPTVPWFARAFTALVVAYALSPIDLIPDFIPVLGNLDDLVIIPLGITIAVKLLPPQVLSNHRAHASEIPDQDGPENWWVAAVIIAIWVAVAAWAGFRIIQWLTS